MDGAVIFSDHMMERAVERGIDMTDVANVIRRGRITATRKARRRWRYAVDGPDVEERPIRLIVQITGKLILITIMRRHRGTQRR
ncbi:MAG: DUF4258 domain-containing protein [Deltaproteobacteria bacterium]|nr:DUF4258 domain-containing protein [Deltaproteobacteria bacterium]